VAEPVISREKLSAIQARLDKKREKANKRSTNGVYFVQRKRQPSSLQEKAGEGMIRGSFGGDFIRRFIETPYSSRPDR